MNEKRGWNPIERRKTWMGTNAFTRSTKYLNWPFGVGQKTPTIERVWPFNLNLTYFEDF